MPLGSWDLKIPHSIAIAVTLPLVMRFNACAAPERFIEIARELGEPVDGCARLEAAGRAAGAVSGLADAIGIPKGLAGFGLREDHVGKVVDEAMKSGNVVVNPRGDESRAARRDSQERLVCAPIRRPPSGTGTSFEATGFRRPAVRGYVIRNPAQPSERLGEFADSTETDAVAAVASASSAAPSWADTPGPQRGAVLFRFAQLLDDAKNELGRIVTLEQGKALAEAVGEVGRAAAEARFMAGEASRAGGHTFPSERAGCRATRSRSPWVSWPRSVPGIFRS